MTRSPMLPVFVALSAALAGSVVLVLPVAGDVDPQVVESIEASPTPSSDDLSAASARPVALALPGEAPRAGMALAATDYAPPPGIVDPPAGHVARRDAGTPGSTSATGASPDRPAATIGR